MSKTTKIAIYSGIIPSTTFIERLIEGLVDKSFEVQLFGGVTSKKTYGRNIKCLGYRNSKFHKAIYLFYYSLILTIFKRDAKQKLDAILNTQPKNLIRAKLNAYPVLWHHPDIFHVQWAKSLEEWTWLKEFGIKLVLSLRGAHINYSPIADNQLAENYRQYFPKVDAFHAVSEAIATEAVQYNAPREKINVVYSGMNLPNLIESKQDNEVFTMISVGRAHWKKGFTYALDACKLLKDNDVSFKYIIVGAKGAIELAYQVKDLALENEVILESSLPLNQVLELMQSADLLLLPSVEEGIANVVIEAMFNKTIVLSTDCGGMRELIRDNENGFLVPIRKADAIASKIMQIVSLSNSQKTKITEKAKKDVDEKHNLQAMVNQMSELYNSVSKTGH